MMIPVTARRVTFWLNRLLARSRLPCPRKMDRMVLVPTAKMTAMEKSRFRKGADRLTALMAYSPTPRATNNPSTMEYREKTIKEATVAVEKRTN